MTDRDTRVKMGEVEALLRTLRQYAASP